MEIYETRQESKFILVENQIHIVFDNAKIKDEVNIELSKKGAYIASIYGLEQVTKFKKLWEEIK
jgi:hypothetical protein